MSFWHKSASIACQSGARAAVAALLRQFSPAAWIPLDLIELRLKQIQSSNSNLCFKIGIFVRSLKFVRRKYHPPSGSHGIPSRCSGPWLGATGSIGYPGPWLLKGWGSITPSIAPGRPTSSCSPPRGNVVTLRTAKLRHCDTCRLTVQHTTPWHGHHVPHHPFPDNDDPWPAALRECLNQCSDEHLQYSRRKQGPTKLPGWREALVHLVHTTGFRDPRLRLIHPTRAKQDADTGPRVPPDGLHLHVGGYCRQGSLSLPTQGAAYHPLAALMYIRRDVLADGEHQAPNADMAWPELLRQRPHAPTQVWLVTTDDWCAQAAEQAQLRAEWVIVQVGAAVPHDPHMAVHSLGDQPEDAGHLVVHQRGGQASLQEHLTALRSLASTVIGAEVRFHDNPAARPNDTLSEDELTPSHLDVIWHSAALNAGWVSPTGYYWIPDAWGHRSSNASGGGPCRHATSVVLAADLTRTWAVAISGTVPDGEGVATSLPLQYGTRRPWLHTVDAEVILHLLRHGDCERTTGVAVGAVKAVNQMPLQWLQDSPRVRGHHTEHPFCFARATSNQGNALLHKADWAASQDTVLQNTAPGPGHAKHIFAGSGGYLDLRPPTDQALGVVAQRAQLDHASTHRGHTPLRAAHARAYVHARDLTAAATNR